MEIIGHQKIVKILDKSIIKNRLAHAYLFYGPNGIGKTKVAEYFITKLLCSSKINQPCGKCENCRQITKKIHPDVIWVSKQEARMELTEKNKIGVEQIHAIRDFLLTSPFSANRKIAIIESADSITSAGANAFLKILEEPPSRSMIVLIARSFYGLPATIRSRCQILRFSPPNKEDTKSFLKEKFSLAEGKADEILVKTANRPGTAINFAQNPEILEKNKKIIDQIVKILSKKDFEAGVELTDFILSFQPNLGEILNVLLGLIRDLIIFKLTVSPVGSIDSNLKRLSNKYSQQELIFLANEIIETSKMISANVNPKLVIGNLFINI